MINTVIAKLIVGIGSSFIKRNNSSISPPVGILYYKPNGSDNWNDNTNWWTNPDGTGDHPEVAPWTADTTTYGTQLYYASGVSSPVSINLNSIGLLAEVTGTCYMENLVLEETVAIYSGNFAGANMTIKGNIAHGNFSGDGLSIDGAGRILDGTFTGDNLSNSGHITGGLFSNAGFLTYGTIEGGTFNTDVTAFETSDITAGTFNGTINNSGAIDGGTFTGSALTNTGTINGGTYNYEIFNNYSIINSTSNPTFSLTNFLNSGSGIIYGGTFTVFSMVNEASIVDGTFNCSSLSHNSGNIQNGMFTVNSFNSYSTIGDGSYYGVTFINNSSAIVNGGIYYNTMFNNYGTLNGGTFSGGTFNNNGTINGGTWPPPPTTTLPPTTTTTPPPTTTTPPPNQSYSVHGNSSGDYNVDYIGTDGSPSNTSGNCGSDGCLATSICLLAGNSPVVNSGSISYNGYC